MAFSPKTNWVDIDIPTEVDFNRIETNIKYNNENIFAISGSLIDTKVFGGARSNLQKIGFTVEPQYQLKLIRVQYKMRFDTPPSLPAGFKLFAGIGGIESTIWNLDETATTTIEKDLTVSEVVWSNPSTCTPLIGYYSVSFYGGGSAIAQGGGGWKFTFERLPL